MAAPASSAASSASRGLRFIDIGINLTDPVFRGNYRGKQLHADDFDQVLARAKLHGVTNMIITGGNLEESRHAVEMAKKYGLYCTVGCHPTRCKEFLTKAESPEAYLDALDKLIGDNLDVVRAIGECGLDYDRTHFCPAEVQRRFFPLHFKLAAKYKLPMFLHDRNTGEDFSRIMMEHADIVRECCGVVHSFTGPVGELQALLKLGLYIGVNGCSMKTDENLRAVSAIPLDRLMLETDAPWCDIRPTHASHELLWPRPHEQSGAEPPKPKKGHHPKGGAAAAGKPRELTEQQQNLAGYAQQLLQPMEQTVKPDKFVQGCMVKGRNEPATMVSVFEVVYALRAAEVPGPVELADMIHATTSRVFRLARSPAGGGAATSA